MMISGKRNPCWTLYTAMLICGAALLSSCKSKSGNAPGAPQSATSITATNSMNGSASIGPVEITFPNESTYTSNASTMTVTGTCSPGVTVYLSGGLNQNTQCSVNGDFSFELTASIDGTLNFSLVQKGPNTVVSTAKSFQWIRNSNLPPNVVITFPALNYHSNQNALTITGSCVDGNTVEMSGDAVQSIACASSAFSFTVNKTSDGLRKFYFLQKNANNVASGTVMSTWTRDTVAPSAPTITNPAINPFSSNTSSLAVIGGCETGATVNLTGDDTKNMICSLNQYSFNITKPSDGSFNFQIAQTDLAGNISTSTALGWNKNTAIPPLLTITNHNSPYTSNENILTLSGACESGNTISVSGDATTNAVCASNAYTVTIPKSSDGNYSFNLKQTNSGGNSSATISFNWKRDTVAPTAPQITNPTLNFLNSHTSSENTLLISGNCEVAAALSLGGDSTQTGTCANDGTFSFTVTKSTDATYNFTLSQTDAAGNISPTASMEWVKSATISAPPVITSPAQSPHRHKQASLTISGTCTNGLDVEISEDHSETVACSSGTFAFHITKSSDGTYQFVVKHKSGSNYSSAASMTWIRDNTAPAAPVITSPTSPHFSNTNSVLITGTCEAGATVDLAGDVPAATTTCSQSGTFSLNALKTTDGAFTISITQTDQSMNTSGAANLSWTRDTIVPPQLTLLTPTQNPFTSNDGSITISGNCEPNATVTMGGADAGTVACSALGLFSFTSTKTTDGAYSYTLLQTDQASNISSPLSFLWNRTTTIPPTPPIQPVITVPTSNPYYSNTNTMNITANCSTDVSPQPATVNLSGDITESEVISPAGALSQDCTNSPVTFTVQKTTDGTYNFLVNQVNPNNSTASANSGIQWIRDTVAPTAPTITTPSVNPFTASGNLTIAGGCEANATVSLTGDATATTTCGLSNTYTFTVNKSVDQTYNFSISQTDIAGNNSTATTLQWVRFNGTINPPTISSPIASSSMNNGNTFNISGTCNNGLNVEISGDVSAADVTTPVGSLTQPCTGGTFLFAINKSTDGTYNFNLKQSLIGGSSSTAVTRTWIRDTIAPSITITSQPSAVNLQKSASFSFNSNDVNATFQCQLDGAAYTSCTSPVTYSTISNGSHTFSIKATDIAGNVSNPTSVTWSQAAYNTIALYHFNNNTQVNDSSFYTTLNYFNNNLTANGAPANAVGVLPTSSPTGRNFGTSKSYSVAHNSTLGLGLDQLTVEGRFLWVTAPSPSGSYYTLVSKSGAAGAYGWEVRFRRITSVSHCFDFVVSLNGTTQTVRSSTTFNASTLTNTWHYFAVTWNKGNVNFYYGTTAPTAKGSATVGTVGSSVIYNSTGAPLRIGAGPASGSGSSLWLNGSLDEVRISQTVRTPVATTQEFTAD